MQHNNMQHNNMQHVNHSKEVYSVRSPVYSNELRKPALSQSLILPLQFYNGKAVKLRCVASVSLQTSSTHKLHTSEHPQDTMVP